MKMGIVVLLGALLGCTNMTQGQGGAGAGGSPGGPTTMGPRGQGDAGSGTGCGTDPNTGVTLCLGTAACPQLTVDPSVYPECGFRPQSGATLDLECVCTGFLCPIGVPSTCDDAAKLLQQQTEAIVCAQVSDGRCIGAGTGVDAGQGGTCDPSCRDSCVGDPTCIQLCGC